MAIMSAGQPANSVISVSAQCKPISVINVAAVANISCEMAANKYMSCMRKAGESHIDVCEGNEK